MSSLDGLRVLEFSGRAAGAYCGKLLAGFGADVIRIPGGAMSPLDDDERAWLLGGRREARLDPNDLLQRASLETLLRNADIVIDAWGIDALAKHGLDAPRLLHLNPRVVLCQITPFGQTGPRRAWQAEDITLYAASGLMAATGDGAREPLNARPRVCELNAGMHAFLACLLSLLRRDRDAAGEIIDLSIHEASLDSHGLALKDFLTSGRVARRNGDQPMMVPWRTYACADGEAAIIGGPIRLWRKAMEAFGIPGLGEPRLASVADRIRHRAEFEGLLAPWLKSKDRLQLFHLGQSQGLAWGYVASLTDAIESPQSAARGFLVPTAGTGTRTRIPGAPFRASRSRWRQTLTTASPVIPAAQVGTAWSAPRRPVPFAPGTHARERAAPLAGIRVLDVTHDLAGPHAARLLADFGAEVVKIEYPKRLDGTRGNDVERLETPQFAQLHRGKRSLAVDLDLPEHRAVVASLLRDVDVVLESARSGVLARKGFPFERVCATNPDVVWISMSAFGATGPWSAYRGYGETLEAITGLQSLTAYDGDSAHFRIGNLDAMNGVMAACAAMTALVHRARTGEGQWIDLAEAESTAWLIGEHFARASRAGTQPLPIGNRHATHAPQGCYAAHGEDRWIALSVRSDEQWRRLARILGRESLADDPRFITSWERRARHGVIDALIGEWVRWQDPEGAVEALQAQGIAAAVVATAADLAADAHLAEREWFQAVGSERYPGFPFRLGSGGVRIRGHAPRLGSANAELFAAAGHTGELPDLAPELLGTAFAMG